MLEPITDRLGKSEKLVLCTAAGTEPSLKRCKNVSDDDDDGGGSDDDEKVLEGKNSPLAA